MKKKKKPCKYFYVVSVMTCLGFEVPMSLKWSLATTTCTTIAAALVFVARSLFFLISFKGQFPSLAANCKPGNRIKTVKALEIQFLLVTANQLVSVNGCGHPPCRVPRALLLPANLTSAF